MAVKYISDVTVELAKELAKPSIREERGTIGKILDIILQIENKPYDARGISISQLIRMTRQDGQAKAILNAIRLPAKMAKFRIVAAEGGEAEAEFVRRNLLSPPSEGGMTIPLRQVITTAVLAVRDGYKIFEKVWKYEDGKYKIEKLAPRSTLDTYFLYDPKTGEIIGARLEGIRPDGTMVKVDYKKEEIFYYIYNAEENPYVGESDFYPVFYHYDKKHRLYAIAHLAYQLNAIPMRIGKHPPTMKGQDLENFRNSLLALGTKVAIEIPNTCEVEKFESTRELGQFLALIQHHDSMMVRSFLLQFLNLGQEGRGGSYALGSAQASLYMAAVSSLLTEIAEAINRQVIVDLIDYNFGTRRYPKLVFEPFSGSSRSLLLEVYRSLLQARFPQVSAEFVLEIEKAVAEELGLDIDYNKIKERWEQQESELEELEELEGEEDEETGEDLKEGEEESEESLDEED